MKGRDFYQKGVSNLSSERMTEAAYKLARGKIRNALIKQLKEKNLYHEPYSDMIERYMSLWDTTIALEYDIKERGVAVEGPTSIKKNDSVGMLVNVNKQMLSILDKLGLQATGIKNEGGVDV